MTPPPTDDLRHAGVTRPSAQQAGVARGVYRRRLVSPDRSHVEGGAANATILITAGASAPEDLVAGLCRTLINRNNKGAAATIEQRDIFREDEECGLPASLKRLMREEGMGGVAGEENKTVGQGWPQCARIEVKRVSLQSRHFQIADNDVVIVRRHLEKRLLAVKRDIDEKILVRQNPLQSRGELFVVVHEEDGFEFKGLAGVFGIA